MFRLWLVPSWLAYVGRDTVVCNVRLLFGLRSSPEENGNPDQSSHLACSSPFLEPKWAIYASRQYFPSLAACRAAMYVL